MSSWQVEPLMPWTCVSLSLALLERTSWFQGQDFLCTRPSVEDMALSIVLTTSFQTLNGKLIWITWSHKLTQTRLPSFTTILPILVVQSSRNRTLESCWRFVKNTAFPSSQMKSMKTWYFLERSFSRLLLWQPKSLSCLVEELLKGKMSRKWTTYLLRETWSNILDVASPKTILDL